MEALVTTVYCFSIFTLGSGSNTSLLTLNTHPLLEHRLQFLSGASHSGWLHLNTHSTSFSRSPEGGLPGRQCHLGVSGSSFSFLLFFFSFHNFLMCIDFFHIYETILSKLFLILKSHEYKVSHFYF